MNLSLISYSICLKASNQSDLMQQNVPAAIFSHGTIFCVRRSVGVVGAVCFPRLQLLPHTAPHWTRCRWTEQHALRTATPCAFGASSTFWWNVSVEKKFVLMLRCANLHLRCTATSISLAPPSIFCAPRSFLLEPHAPPSIVLVPQQMAAVNFGSFLLCKIICQNG